MILYHDPVVNAVMNDVYSVNKSIDDNSKITFRDEHKEKQVQAFIEESRSASKCRLHQSLMMSTAWVLPRERELFLMFPEVITVDCTADTNNEARPLLTMAGKDFYGRMFIFLRAFLLNERNWVFCCIFSIVLPKFFQTSTFQRSEERRC